LVSRGGRGSREGVRSLMKWGLTKRGREGSSERGVCGGRRVR
jgi:hypothetical protein